MRRRGAAAAPCALAAPGEPADAVAKAKAKAKARVSVMNNAAPCGSPAIKPSPRRPLRFGTRTVFTALALLALCFSGYGWFHRKIVAPRRHADAVERKLESLIHRRPRDMTRGQWGSAVAWTLNLHGNSLLMFEAEGPSIKAFEQRLEQRLAGEVDMETIHWIWNEYADLCPHGASYQRFKVQMQEEIDSVGPEDDVWGMNVP